MTVLLVAVVATLALATSAAAALRSHSATRSHSSTVRCVTSSHARARRSAAACANRAPAKRTVVKSVPAPLAPALAGGSSAAAPVTPRVSPPGKAHVGPGEKVIPTAPAPTEGNASESEAGESLAEAPGGNLPLDGGETVGDPIDPRFLTDLPFGKTSFWLQPWRAYMDTLPASRLQQALGINFTPDPAQADATAQLLHDSGFELARVGINWGALSYAEPSTFRESNLAHITTILTALREHGLRPLIVLDANSDAPAPYVNVKLETAAVAAAGAQSVTLTPASAALVVPGKTGFNNLTFGGSPDEMITAVNAHDVATLSRPLPNPLPAGSHGGTTLRYAPFQAPTLPGGAPNPVYQTTLAGWLTYVRAVTALAASVVGPGGYDIEVWNELTFGSQFLNAEHYYSQSPVGEEAGAEAEAESETEASTEADAGAEAEGESGSDPETGEGVQVQSATAPATAEGKSAKKLVSKQVRKALLAETVAFIRNPANGISPSVAITDGFASQTPFPSGADAPFGLTALSKHPYTGPKSFPAAYHVNHDHPLGAQGFRDTSNNKSFTPLFVPTFQAMFPEYWLSAISTETLVRDLAPFTTDVYDFPHGREVAPAGSQPIQKWITEFNLSSQHGTVVGPDEVTPQSGPSAQLTPADRAHFQAKVALRSLVSSVNKGFSREYFFTASPGSKSLINPSFFTEVEADHGAYPGDQAGGETMSALHSLLGQFQGPGPGTAARQLTLRSIVQEGNHAQFAGDGTAAHPSLYDRDVLAVLPFQSSPTRFAIPVYVMTRDLLTLYEPGAPAGDVHRFDLPDENFKITLGNLPETTAAPTVGAYDPLLDSSTPARLISREGSSAVFELAATDYPRVLTLEYPGA
ncbi:MAG TPA: hypothetical protein VGN25_04595 [Solirubrobacteraceae bacterium]|nr:hypothetical protein [Solirubrobacteraceae bacterium]